MIVPVTNIMVSITKKGATIISVLYRMIKERELKQRLAHFRRQIRSEQIEQFKSKVRRQLLNSSPAFLNQLLPNRPYLLTIEKVFLEGRQVLLEPFGGEMREEGVETGISLSMHIQFWEHFLYELSQNRANVCGLLPELGIWLLQFSQRHAWSRCASEPEYAGLLGELVEVAVGHISDSGRLQLAEWISDQKWIGLVQLLITSSQTFPHPNQTPKLYSLLQLGLSGDRAMQQASAHLLLQITLYANTAQNYLLYKSKPQLFFSLLRLLRQSYHSVKATHFWPPLLCLCNTYSDALGAYLRAGLLPICAGLLTSNIDNNVYGALSLLRVFSLDEEAAEILMEQQKSQGTKFWLEACIDGKVFTHQKLDIQRMAFEVMRNLLFKGSEKECHLLCGRFDVKGKAFREIVFEVWQTSHRDNMTVCFTLECISKLLLVSEQGCSCCSALVGWLKSSSILSFVEKCSFSTSQGIKQISVCILRQLEENRCCGGMVD